MRKCDTGPIICTNSPNLYLYMNYLQCVLHSTEPDESARRSLIFMSMLAFICKPVCNYHWPKLPCKMFSFFKNSPFKNSR